MNRVLCTTALLSLLCVTDAGASPAVNKTANSDWASDRSQGERLDLKNDSAGALALYERSLKKLPPNALTEKIDLQCLIAVDCLRLRQDDKAEATINAMLSNFKKLRAANALTPDTEMSVHTFIEEIDGYTGVGLPVEQVHKRNMLALRVAAEILPNLMTFQRVSKITRGYLGRGKSQLALEYVEVYVARMPKTDKRYGDLLLNEAALKGLLHDYSSLEAIAKEMRKTKSASVVAARIAESQTWATDYLGAEKTLDRCQKELKDKKSLTQADEVRLDLARVGNYLDRGLWVKCEQLARHCLTLKLDADTRRLFLNDLAFCLSSQGRNKEARALEAQANQFNFLIDDEREVSAELDRKHAKKH